MQVLKLSIIIVNYNVKYFLEHSLHAVMLAASGIQAEIIVVDNNSSDESIAYLKEKFPSVIYIANKENTGFAKANNQGLAIAKGEYILYLNPDTLIAENTLKDCINFLDENKNASSIGVQMLDGSGTFLPESKRSFPSASTSFYKLFLIEKIFPKSRTFGKYGLGFLDKNKIHEVDVLAGAFIMARSFLLKQINGFDERYFMYGEDIDLSFTLQKLGCKNYYLGNISIIHFKGESTKKGNLQYVKIFYGAMIKFVEKHYKGTSGKAYTRFLKLAIKARSSFSAINNSFRKNKKTTSLIEQVFIIGEEKIAAQAKNICEKNLFNIKYIFQKNADENLFKQKNAAYIFCIGKDFSYAKSIQLLQQNSPVENVFWFYENANSIIGSSHKNISGEVFI